MKERIRRCGFVGVAAVALAQNMHPTSAFSFQQSTSTHQPWMSNTQQSNTPVPKTSWWPPTQGYNNNAAQVPGSFFPSPQEYHQEELSIEKQANDVLSDDPLAVQQLCNTLHQAACDALIYQKRWRYCIGVWDDRLLEWMVGAAATGNFWTPKTYLVVAANNDDDYSIDHPLWQQWEGTKPLNLALTTEETEPALATAAAAENVKKLRSLASRILPRLDNSGQKATDIPVFDTLVITSLQLQSLLQEVARDMAKEKAASEAHQHHYKNSQRKKKKKRKRQKNQDVPWVVPVTAEGLLLPSVKVLQAAKQLVVVQTTATIEFDQEALGNSLDELFPNAMWLESTAIAA